MAEPFLAEIRLFSFNYAPRGWSTCDGQMLQIMQNQALFSLINITFGGDGRTTFALPNLRGRVPVHPNNSTVLYGNPGGQAQHALTMSELPAHNHTVLADQIDAVSISPAAGDGGEWAVSQQLNPYAPFATDTHVTLHPGAIMPTGGGQAHNNMQPYQTINFCIALTGIYPIRP